jgi:hypothetical protein
VKTWVYKCNRRGTNGPASGDWNDLFDRGDEIWGADTLRGMKKVQAGDRLIAVQTDRRELVGVARALRFAAHGRANRLHLRAIETIRANIPALKKADSRIRVDRST